MKFFKHFTDAHRGKSLQQLKRRFGFDGIGRYWTFIELCAEKMTKEQASEFTEEHCVFEFERSYLMLSLGYANLKQASSYLQAMAELGLCSVEAQGELYRCSVPKLLECMDRDSKRARQERAAGAPKKKIKKKIKDKEEDKDKEGEEEHKITQNNPTITQTKPKVSPKKPKHSPESPSSSSSKELRKEEKSGPGPDESQAIVPDGPIGQEIVGEFYARWRERYHKRAPLLDADRKQLKRLAESLGLNEAKSLIRRYLSMDEAWFKTKSHDVSTLMSNLPKIQAGETKLVRFAVPD